MSKEKTVLLTLEITEELAKEISEEAIDYIDILNCVTNKRKEVKDIFFQ